MNNRRAITRRRSKRAMWLALALFFVGQAVIGYLLDYQFPVTKFPSAGATADRAAVESKPPEIVFFGSSRTMTGVVTPEADRILAEQFGKPNAPHTFNAGVVAGDSYSAELVFDSMLAKGVKPRWVILEVSPEMLGAQPPFIGQHVFRQFTWEHVTELPAMLNANSALPYAEARFAPIYTHRKELVKQGKESIRGLVEKHPVVRPVPVAKPAAGTPVVTDGAGDMVPSFAPRVESPEEEARLLAQSRFGAERVVRRWLRNYRIGGPAPPALERILARCRAEGIQVILLGIPACTAHRREFTSDMLAMYSDYIAGLVRTYHCRFVDAMEWVPDLQFGDTLHIRSETGGIAFTARFTREILVPALK